MAFRFIHTADIHLDSPLRSLSLRNEHLATLIGNASRQVLSKIVDLAIEERVDGLIIAGDLYDGSQTSMKTARFLTAELKRLDDAHIACFIIRGNHDAASLITQELTLPANVTVFKTKAHYQIIKTDTLHIAIHGLSFKDKTAPNNLLPLYTPPLADHINIGLMHTSLDGTSGHDHYAPCSVSDLQNSGFQYWALGHIHKRLVFDNKLKQNTIVMPGIPQGRDINENGAKSITLVTIGDDGQISYEERPISLTQFERVTVDVTNIDNKDDVIKKIEKALIHAKDSIRSHYFVARITLRGATPLNWHIINDHEIYLNEIKYIGESLGNIWIDKLSVETQSPIETSLTTTDPIFELASIMNEMAKKRQDLREKIEDLAIMLRNDHQLDLKHLIGNDEKTVQQFITKIIDEGNRDVIARLKA